jgi:hypothetical protein
VEYKKDVRSGKEFLRGFTQGGNFEVSSNRFSREEKSRAEGPFDGKVGHRSLPAVHIEKDVGTFN